MWGKIVNWNYFWNLLPEFGALFIYSIERITNSLFIKSKLRRVIGCECSWDLVWWLGCESLCDRKILKGLQFIDSGRSGSLWLANSSFPLSMYLCIASQWFVSLALFTDHSCLYAWKRKWGMLQFLGGRAFIALYLKCLFGSTIIMNHGNWNTWLLCVGDLTRSIGFTLFCIQESKFFPFESFSQFSNYHPSWHFASLNLKKLVNCE